MRHILVVVQQGDRNDVYKYGSWVAYRKTIEELTKQNKDFESLADNILLIPLRNGVGVLPQIFQALADVQYKYKYLEGEPQWREGPMDIDTQG